MKHNLPQREFKIIERTGYVYSLWSGQFKIKYGIIRQLDEFSEIVYMKTTDHKTLLVASEPGVVYNSMVWLEDRDDNYAIEILTEYEQTQIKKLLQKVESHFSKIDELKKARIKHAK